MIFRLHFLLILLTGFVLSCSTGPEFERTNENDPASDQFKPDTPSGPNFSISNDTLVTISWQDITQFESEYSIQKQVGNFYSELVAVLPSNAETFVDSTKELGYSTSYRVFAKKDTLTSDSLTINLDFGKIEELSSSFVTSEEGKTQIKLTWIDNSMFEDGFFLYKTFRDEPTELVRTLDPNTESVTIDLPNDGFVHSYKVFPFMNFKNNTTISPEDNSTSLTLKPNNFEMKLISQDSLLLNWDFASDFHNGFLVTFESQTEKKTFSVDKNVNHLIIQEEVIKNFNYRASISAFKGNTLSPKTIVSNQFELPSILIDSIAHSSESEILIRTINRSETRITKNVYRSIDFSDSFIKVGEIPKGKNEFLDKNLNINSTYTYYISTNLSDNSLKVTVSNRKGLRFLQSYKLKDQVRYFTTGRMNRNKKQNSLFTFDYDSRNLQRIDYLINEPINEINYDSYAIELDQYKDHNFIAVITSTEIHNKLLILDRDAQIFIDSVNLNNNSSIRNIKFISNKILYLKSSESNNWQLVSSTLDGIRKDTLLTFITSDPSFTLNQAETELTLVKNEINDEFQLLNYSLSETFLTLNETSTLNRYPINFSPTLDSIIVSRARENITVINVESSDVLSSNELGFYNSNSISESFFFDDGLLFVPDQAGAYIIDSKNSNDPILQEINFDCCRITFAGAFWDTEKNNIIDMRRSHTSGVPSYYTVYSIESFWRILDN